MWTQLQAGSAVASDMPAFRVLRFTFQKATEASEDQLSLSQPIAPCETILNADDAFHRTPAASVMTLATGMGQLRWTAQAIAACMAIAHVSLDAF